MQLKQLSNTSVQTKRTEIEKETMELIIENGKNAFMNLVRGMIFSASKLAM
jgi:hypothetical protein